MYDDAPQDHLSEKTSKNTDSEAKLKDIEQELTSLIETEYHHDAAEKPHEVDIEEKKHLSVESALNSGSDEEKEEEVMEKADTKRFMAGVFVFLIITFAAGIGFVYFLTQQGSTITKVSNVQVSGK